MAKKIIDRVFKTIMIVIDVIFGGIFTVYGASCLFRNGYDVERDIPAVMMCMIVLAIVNLSNVIIRKWIKEY